MSGEPHHHAAGSDQAAGEVQRRFAHLEAQFERLKNQVRQAQQLSALGTAAATMAHEVNNLLTPILGYAQAAEGSGDAELMKRALGVTIRNSQVLIAMSERMLNISAARSARAQSVNVRSVVEGARASLCRDLAKDGITFALEAEESLSVWADPLQLQQVLFNLFLNAHEAMAPSHGGRLTVSARQDGGDVVIQVRNTGAPIPPELLPHVFDPLESSKSAARNSAARCSGLGLALCRDLMGDNGGRIDAASDPAGTVFTLTLPGRAARP